MATLLRKALAATVATSEGGRAVTMSKLEIAVTQLVNKAAKGDPRAFRELAGLIQRLGLGTEALGAAVEATVVSFDPDDQAVVDRFLARERQAAGLSTGPSYTIEGDNDDDLAP